MTFTEIIAALRYAEAQGSFSMDYSLLCRLDLLLHLQGILCLFAMGHWAILYACERAL